MSKFNSSISIVGIKEPKVQQAILKLLENSLYQQERLGKTSDKFKEELRRIRQTISTMDFDIDETTAQEIADKISAAIGTSVTDATNAAANATSAAQSATEKASQASADAAEVKKALTDIEGTIQEYAESAAEKATEEAVAKATETATTAAENATSAAEEATAAAESATQKASQASTSAQNAATTAEQAATAAQNATAAVTNLRVVNLATASSQNTTYDQYRKIATLPAVSHAYGAFVTIYGSLGVTNNVARPIYVSIAQRQSDVSWEALDVHGYVFRASLPQSADIVLYKESNGTFSLYLKGIKSTYFKHNVAMMYDEKVTPVSGSFTTTVPTGTLVWSLLANYKIVATTEDVSTAIANLKSSANTWPSAQTFTSLITANGKVHSKGTGVSYYAGRSGAAFRNTYGSAGYVPTVSCKSNTGSWEIGTYTENNQLHFVFVTDENFESQTNSPSVNIILEQTGRIRGVVAPASTANDTYVPTTAWVRTYASGAFQPKGSYAAASHTHNYAPSTREYVAWSHINVDLAGSTFLMSGLVSDSSGTYNVRVTFRNTASGARTCKVNGVSVSLASGAGSTAIYNFTTTGSGSFTIDNITSAVDVFVRIWR